MKDDWKSSDFLVVVDKDNDVGHTEILGKAKKQDSEESLLKHHYSFVPVPPSYSSSFPPLLQLLRQSQG